MSRIEVVRQSADGLRREVWRFDLLASRFSGVQGAVNAVVSYYGIEERATARHKFKVTSAARYDSFDPRPYNSGIKSVDVPLPADVEAEAISRVAVVVRRPEVDRRGFD